MKRFLLAVFLAVYSLATLKHAAAQAPSPAQTKPAPQRLDEEYTKLIKQYLQDPRVTTELVDHMPASDTVPSPLKFFGRIPGTPGELTYSKDINRYYEALATSVAARQVLEDRAVRRRAATRSCLPSPMKPPSKISTSTKPCSPRSAIREKPPKSRRRS